MTLQDDAVLRQRAGFVGAQHIHRAKILNRIEALRDDLSARHRDRTLGEVDRHDHGQHFGCEANGHRHCEQQRLQPIVLGHTIDQEHARHHDNDEADHQPGEPVDSPIERGGNASPGDLVCELAEECALSGPQQDAYAIARYDIRAHEAQVRQVERTTAVLLAGVGILLRGHGLAGQGRLVDEQVLGFEQAQVRRDHIAGGQPHDIARHQPLDRDFDERLLGMRRTTAHAGRGVDHGTQPRGGLVRPVLLDERGRCRQHHHGGDDNRRPHVAQEPGDDRQRQQQRVQRVPGTAPQFLRDRRPALARDQIEPELPQATFGLARGEALRA